MPRASAAPSQWRGLDSPKLTVLNCRTWREFGILMFSVAWLELGSIAWM